MPAKPPKLPIGIQAFEIIRENGYLYVDKTAHLSRMIDDGMFYFLARPRRFGKSLTVSTLKCLFQGRRELFRGLRFTQRKDWAWHPHPVVTIDFNQIPHHTPESLEHGITLDIEKTATEWEIPLKTPFIETQFQELISGLRKKTGRRVVILADEYDKPLIDHLGKGDTFLNIAKANRDILKRFFGVLKGADIAPMLRFVFLTGISKFSRVSIFSELNNLDDITMNRHYSEMLGYTPAELDADLSDHVTAFSKKTGISRSEILRRLKDRYDGYRFSGDEATVYNPHSVLKALHHMEFKDYWFETGTPTFLVNLLRERHYPLPEIENMAVDEQVFSSYDLNDLKPEAILFQTGYVTITGRQGDLFRLGYPNLEVRNSFLKHLVFAYTKGVSGGESSRFLLLADYLRQENFDAFFNTIKAIFAAIPYTLESKRDEAYFHTLFYLMVSASGTEARSEVLTCRGRIDLVVSFPDKIFLMEFKCDQSAAAGIRQIQEKGYAESYSGTGRAVFLMGINFSTETRNVSEWKIERLKD